MRLAIPALTGCLVSGLACFLHVVGAAQIPFSIKSLPQAAGSPAPPLAHHPTWTLPRGSNNSAVVFDKYSLAIAGGQQRLFILAAEFHPWRLPVPSLWRDVLQKIRAAGFNTVSIYTHWGLIQPSQDPVTIDLTGINDLDYFLTVAKETGLFVIVRPGPYINAETTVGGMAPWTVNINATLRTNDTAWSEAWKPYINAVSDVVVKHQLVHHAGQLRGGSVILVQADNEYKTGPRERAYMIELIRTLKTNGITIPITYNDPGREGNFVDLVDLYGLDSYPQRFDCSHPTTWVPFRDDYLEYHMETNPDQPFYIPEFQGGSYDPFGGPGYESCGSMTNASFTRVANLALVAQRVTMLSLYMVYGGTNWGGLAEPDVYTSYDYGAALDEHRRITDKYTEVKRQGYFTGAFPDLAMTEQIVDKPGFNLSQTWDLDANKSVDATIFRATVLENPETKSKFYVVRYDNTTEARRVSFALEIESLGKTLLVGERREGDSVVNYLNGRDSHIIPVDQELPGGLLLRFSTANVYRVVTTGNNVVISLDYGPDQPIEYSLRVQMSDDFFQEMQMFSSGEDGNLQMMRSEEWEEVKRLHSDIKSNGKEARGILPSAIEGSRFMTYTTVQGMYVVLHFAPTFLTRRDFATPARYLGNPSSAVQRPSANVVNQFFGHSDDSVVVINADLLRNATYTTTENPLDTLLLWGSMAKDSNTTAIMALPNLKYVYWNGERVEARAQEYAEWFYNLHLPGPSPSALAWKPPSSGDLTWRWRDSLPEAEISFDDGNWVVANRTTSHNPYTQDPTLDTQGDILFASEYGFHANNIVWRGQFHVDPKRVPKDVRIKVEGGRSSAFSVWLNGVYLGSGEAGRETSASSGIFTISHSILLAKEEGSNVLTVLQDHMGIEMEAGELPIGLIEEKRGLEAVKLPRGIVGFSFPSLRDSNKTEPEVRWTVQGNYRGEQAPDSVRRSLNEGGLHAEVQGWHLPGFDDSYWSDLTHFPKGRVIFYRSTFDLDAPEGVDIGLNFVFGKMEGRKFRAQLYVNGWQMGKYINHLGPQTVFPVHSGVVHLRGRNEVGVSVWLLDDEEWGWDPRRDLEIRVNHVLSGEPRDGYELVAGGWQELRR